MANTLTSLIPDFYRALEVVSREMVGFIPSVARDASADQVAANQTLRIAVSPANAAGKNITPAMSLPAASDQTIGNASLTISKSRAFPFSWSGEEQKSVDAGPGFLTIQQGQVAQAIRAAVNEMELDIATAAYKSSSRAYGTAGTTPFGTAGDYTDSAQTKKLLDDNGAPLYGRSLIVNTSAGASVRGKQAQAYMAGSTDLLRQGTLLDMSGFMVKESAQIQTPAAGAMASATTTAAVLAIGQTVLPLATAGTGVVAAGDIITLANDTNKYVVVAVSFAGSNPASGDSITIGAPGLRVAQTSAARAITVVAAAARNIAFTNNAILLATRLPAVPKKGDLASDRMVVTDPLSGISLGLAYYPGYMMGLYELQLAWGVSVIKPEHVVQLLG